MTRRTLDRREFLRRSALLGASAAAAAVWPRLVRARAGPRIVIVGGGLAGLTAAYQLATRYRLNASVYEAQLHWGGRASTERSFAGQSIERGGQFISSGDRSIRKLVRALGLSLIDTRKVGPDGAATYRFLGQAYDYDQLEPALVQAQGQAAEHAREAGRSARYDHKNDRTEHWDNVSVGDWLDTYCPGGLDGAAGQYLKTFFETDYAGPVSEASALQVIYELGLRASAGAYDERYLVQGGTDSIVSALLSRLPSNTFHTGTALQHLQVNADGSVRCTFGTSTGGLDVDADRVVLAVPFSTLRDVDYAAMGFDARLDTAIRTLGMGANAKVHFQFSAAPWQPMYSGESLSDLTTGATWDEGVGQTGGNRVLVLFNGGNFGTQYGAAAAHGSAPPAVVGSHLAALDEIFPGASSYYTGNAYLDSWASDAGVRGSYSYYKVGQMTAIAGIEAVPQGRVHFAGEHTAPYAHRGTLNGAVASGLRVAREVVRAAA